MEALGDGGGVAEETAAERAREARRERRPLQPHHVPDSSAPSRPRSGRRGWRLESEDGALHAAGRKSPSTKRRRYGFEASPLLWSKKKRGFSPAGSPPRRAGPQLRFPRPGIKTAIITMEDLHPDYFKNTTWDANITRRASK